MDISIPKITLNHCGPLAYRQLGKKRPHKRTIVLLHGNSYSSEIFEPIMQNPLVNDAHVIAFDLPGHGWSKPLDRGEEYTFETIGARIIKAMNALDLQDVVLVGWSLGGHVALDMLDRSDRINSAVICGAPLMPSGALSMLWAYHFSLDMLLASKRNFTTHDAKRFEKLTLGDAADSAHIKTILGTDHAMRPSLAKSVMQGANRDQHRLALESQKPILLVQGEKDALVRTSYLVNFAKNPEFSGAMQIIRDAGHAPFLSQPDAFLDALMGFIGRADDENQKDENTALKAA